MKYYIEVFDKTGEDLKCCIETGVLPTKVAEVFKKHPVGCFQLTPEISSIFGFDDLNFENSDCFLSAVRDFKGETYEWNEEVLYPPPLFFARLFK